MHELYDEEDGTSQADVDDPLTRPATAGESAVAGHPLPRERVVLATSVPLVSGRRYG
jgi:hypothetical protein